MPQYIKKIRTGFGDLQIDYNALANLPKLGNFIDVEELPTRNIDENKIYRIKQTMLGSPKIYFVDGSGGEPMDIEELAASEGITISMYVVDNAQTYSMTTSTDTNIYVYIDSETGIAYLDYGYGVWTVGFILSDIYSAELPDNGWSTDITSETNLGIYCVRGDEKTYYNYHSYKNGIWTELTSGSIVGVEQLPSDNIDANKIYRLERSNDSADVWLLLDVSQGPQNLTTLFQSQGITCITKIVDTIPTEVEISTNTAMYLYVVDSTGIVYMDEGKGNGVQTIGEASFGSASANKGWAESEEDMTEGGFYCTRIGVNKTSYYLYTDGAWSEISVGGKIELDTSLSKEGMAADAKAVGDKFNNYETKENVQKIADELAGVKATAEAARTEEEVNAQIDTKIGALNLATTYEPIGAETRAKVYADDLITDANLGQYTTEQEVKDIVDTVVADAVSGDAVTGLANLVEYFHEHGEEAAQMSAAIDVLEGDVKTLKEAPSASIKATDISAWNNEVGAKALAATKTTTEEVKAQIEAYGYAKKAELGALASKSTVIKSDLDDAVQASLDKADTALQTHQSLADYAKKTDIPTVPTNVSAFENDAGYLTSYTESDPTVPSHVKEITTTDISNWNAKSEFSGDYNDLTNKPTIPSITGLATETYVDNKVASIVDSSPEALNTLNELAAALGDDPNFATNVATEIGKKADKSSLAAVATSGSYNDLTNKPTLGSLAAKSTVAKSDLDSAVQASLDKADTALQSHQDISGKVDKVSGKGLSTNDFTDDYKESIDKLTGQYYSKGLAYTLSGEDYSVSGLGTCTDTDIVVPLMYNGKRVTSIRNYAFMDRSSLTSITIPDSVTNIGESAFYKCNSLEAVYITDLVAWCNISFNNFSSNPLYYANNLYLNGELVTELVIPNGVTSIGSYAFNRCRNLTSITIPDSVTSIGNESFSSCSSLTSVNIGDGVTSIGNRAFWNCSSLKIVTIGNSVTSIGNSAFAYCSALTSIIIPNTVTSIDESAFSQCKKATIYCEAESQPEGWNSDWNSNNRPVVWGFTPDYTVTENYSQGLTYTLKENHEYEVTGIGTCADTNVVIPAALYGHKVTSIKSLAFSDCTSLMSITIPNSVTSIGAAAFKECSSLTSITIPNSVTSIGNNAFWNCISLPSITIPDSITCIERGMFLGCISLTSITIPNSVTNIKDGAFEQCKSLINVYITDLAAWCNITFNDAFSNPFMYAGKLYVNGQLISELTIPNSVTSIGNKAFRNCSSLKSVTIPDSVTSIGDYAFDSCGDLTRVTISDSVTSIGTHAFRDCSSLTSIIIPDSVTSIGDYAFESCTSLTNIAIPDSVTSIGKYAFRDCSSLERVTIPSSVSSIGYYAFDGCSYTMIFCAAESQPEGWNSDWNPDDLSVVWGSMLNFSTVTQLNMQVDALGQYSKGLAYTRFHKEYRVTGIGTCTDTNIVIPVALDGIKVTSIGSSAFSGCSSLTSVTIGNSVTSIGSSAFSGCSSLTSVTIGNSVTSIGSYTFQNCSSLLSITIPDSVTSIGYGAFWSCSSLTSITIPDSITSVDSYAFVNCSKLTIYCEAESQPEGWAANWNPDNCPVVWGASLDFASVNNNKELYLHSSTAGSTKKFKITVDDNGTITATAVT